MHLIWCPFCTGSIEKGANLGITFEVFLDFGADDYTDRSGMGASYLKQPDVSPG